MTGQIIVFCDLSKTAEAGQLVYANTNRDADLETFEKSNILYSPDGTEPATHSVAFYWPTQTFLDGMAYAEQNNLIPAGVTLFFESNGYTLESAAAELGLEPLPTPDDLT
jgi:hypothetical protein